MAIDPQALAAANPDPVDRSRFNPDAALPFGLTTAHVCEAMETFVHFLGFINGQLVDQGSQRLESMLIRANVSSVVGEYIRSNIPTFYPGLAKNTYHNGPPDLVPAGVYPNDAVPHGSDGIEVKASRYASGWQGHNPEDCWPMVFVYDGNRPVDAPAGIDPKPFRFLGVVGGKLTLADWGFSGRSETSRRTITASVLKAGRNRIVANWIYKIPGSVL